MRYRWQDSEKYLPPVMFAHRGALFWNNLRTEIKSAKSYKSFKNRFKKKQQLSVDVNLA